MAEEKNGGKPVIYLSQVIEVIFGNVKVTAIIAAAILVVFTVFLYVFSSISKEYECVFSYNVTGLTNTTYLDGSKFDIRDVGSLDSLNEYKQQDSSLSSINFERVYHSDDIKITTIVAEQEESEKEQEVKKELPNSYSINLKCTAFSKQEALALVIAMSEKPINDTMAIIDGTSYLNNLTHFESAKTYGDKIDYLLNQIELLTSKYEEIIENYGDVLIDGANVKVNANDSNASKKVSEYMLDMLAFFRNNSVEDLEMELALSGYIKEDNIEDQRIVLVKKNEQLRRSLNLLIAKLDSIVDLRDSLVDRATGTSLQSLELETYNIEIVKLTDEIENTREEIALSDIMIANLDEASRDPEYATNLVIFDNKVSLAKDSVEYYTKQLTNIEKTVCRENCKVYYEKGAMLNTVGGLSLLSIFGISVLGAIIIPIIFNLLRAIVLMEKNKKA